MPEHKIVDTSQLDADLTSIANAIRDRAGTHVKIEFPKGFASAIRNIPGDVEGGVGIEVESLSQVHYWTKTGKTGGIINETYQSNGTMIGVMNETVQYADEVTLDGNNLALVNPRDYTVTSDDDAAEDILVGKYVYCTSNFYRIPSDAVIIYYAANQYMAAHLNANKVYKLSVTPGTEEQVTIVVSENSAAYPENGEQDGFTYVYQGVVGTELPALSNPGTASDVAKGKQLINANGNVVTGTHECVNGIDTWDATATEDEIRKGRTAYVKGEKITGTMETLATTTITPGTTAQTITRKYIDGTLTIKGDYYLKPENIKEGVRIFDVLGTLAASSGGTVEIGEGIEVESLSEAHYWTKSGMVGGTINETYQSGDVMLGVSSDTVQYADEVVLEGNSLVLVNPKSYTLATDDDAAEEILVGKYVRTSASRVLRIPSEARIIYRAPTQYTPGNMTVSNVYELSVTPGTEEQFSIVVSGDRNAYPDNGEKDGFTYVYQGVVSESDLPEVEQATPTISVDANGLITASATQEAGQVAAGTKSATKQLATQAAQTITPSTEDKTIASGKYLTGTQTIKGDSNLKAENIKKGVSIFGVDGSHECEEGVTLPELSNPGTASDMALGKELIDQNGNVVTGTLAEVTVVLGLAKQPDSVVYSGESKEIQILSGMYSPTDFIARSSIKFRSRVPATEFGNATADQVSKKATFTSANGLLVPGELPDGGMLRLTGGSAYGYIGDGTGVLLEASADTDRIIRAGDEVGVVATYDKFGNATAAYVAKGKTFTSVAGLLAEGALEESEVGKNVWAADDVSLTGTPGDTTFHIGGVYGKSHIGSDTFHGFICRPGTGFWLRNVSTSMFGNATADQVAKGATFTSASGLLLEGTHECEGVELPELTNPAASYDLVYDKQLIDSDGHVVTGTLGEATNGLKVMGQFAELIGTPGNTTFNVTATYLAGSIGDNTTGCILRPGALLTPRNIPTNLFGDARPEEVKKGVTFTSAAGLLVEGTREEPTAETWVLTLQDGSTVEKVVHIE